MVRWVVRSILHGVDSLSYFLFKPVLHNWCKKGCGMCYPECGMVHINKLLLLILVAAVVTASFLSHYLSGPLPCLMPYNRKENVLSASLNKIFPSFLPLTMELHLALYLERKPDTWVLFSISIKDSFINESPHRHNSSRGALAGTRHCSMGPP